MTGADLLVYYAGLFCYGALLGTLWGQAMFDDEDRRYMEAWDDEFYTQREDDWSILKGFGIAAALTGCFAYAVYRIMSWYMSTMPPVRFH